MDSQTQLVPFKLIQMPCCGQLVCWINPRLPNNCPECGTPVFLRIKESILNSVDAILQYEVG